MSCGMDEIYEVIEERIGDDLYEKSSLLTENEIEKLIEEIMSSKDFCIYNYLGDDCND